MDVSDDATDGNVWGRGLSVPVTPKRHDPNGGKDYDFESSKQQH